MATACRWAVEGEGSSTGAATGPSIRSSLVGGSGSSDSTVGPPDRRTGSSYPLVRVPSGPCRAS